MLSAADCIFSFFVLFVHVCLSVCLSFLWWNKRILKSLILEVQGLSKSLMLMQLKSSSLVLVVIGSMPMPIRGSLWLFDAFVCRSARFLEFRKSRLDRRNLCSLLKISHAASPCLSQLISAQFALETCLAAQNRQKIHKTSILAFKVIQGQWIRWQCNHPLLSLRLSYNYNLQLQWKICTQKLTNTLSV